MAGGKRESYTMYSIQGESAKGNQEARSEVLKWIYVKDWRI